MKPNPERKDLVELFGYGARDISKTARSLWNIGACPFTEAPCIKHNHDQTIVYGTCSVSSSSEDVIICPNRLYARDYESIRRVAIDAFGQGTPFLRYSEYVQKRGQITHSIVALGQNSGKEVKVGQSLSMDWVLAEIVEGRLIQYVGIEVQSIDITGNYRDAWHGYKVLPSRPEATIPASAHGLNWANVHKRLIPQIIRKSLLYSRSEYVKKGLYFVVPDVVYRRFERVLGDLPTQARPSRDTITVQAYQLGPQVPSGQQRELSFVRQVRFLLSDMSLGFMSGADLPGGDALDRTVKSILGVH